MQHHVANQLFLFFCLFFVRAERSRWCLSMPHSVCAPGWAQLLSGLWRAVCEHSTKGNAGSSLYSSSCGCCCALALRANCKQCSVQADLLRSWEALNSHAACWSAWKKPSQQGNMPQQVAWPVVCVMWCLLFKLQCVWRPANVLGVCCKVVS